MRGPSTTTKEGLLIGSNRQRDEASRSSIRMGSPTLPSYIHALHHQLVAVRCAAERLASAVEGRLGDAAMADLDLIVRTTNAIHPVAHLASMNPHEALSVLRSRLRTQGLPDDV